MISLAGTLLALIFWVVKEITAHEQNPMVIHQKAYEETDRQIATHDARAATITVDNLLLLLQSRERGS